MDAFLDDIKDVEDKADVAVPQPFWKQDSWKHVGPLTWFRQEDLIEHERDESSMMKWENAESMNINDMNFRGQLYDKMTWMVIIVMIHDIMRSSSYGLRVFWTSKGWTRVNASPCPTEIEGGALSICFASLEPPAIMLATTVGDIYI